MIHTLRSMKTPRSNIFMPSLQGVSHERSPNMSVIIVREGFSLPLFQFSGENNLSGLKIATLNKEHPKSLISCQYYFLSCVELWNTLAFSSSLDTCMGEDG
jgi:hypothetical protein